MNVFVTGGSGFVGRHLCALLRERGHAFTAPSSSELDLRRPFKIPGHYDALIHLAAHNITSVGDQDPDAFWRVNVEGTRHVLEGVDCDHIIFISTLKVHDPAPGLYARSKIQAEEIARRGRGAGRALTIIRGGNIWGKGQAPKAVLPVFLNAARKGEALIVLANPLTPIAYIDARDMAEVILRALQRPSGDAVYNAAYPTALTLRDLALKVIAACRSSSRMDIREPAMPSPMGVIDCRRTWDELGFMPRYGIDRILTDILS